MYLTNWNLETILFHPICLCFITGKQLAKESFLVLMKYSIIASVFILSFTGRILSQTTATATEMVSDSTGDEEAKNIMDSFKINFDSSDSGRSRNRNLTQGDNNFDTSWWSQRFSGSEVNHGATYSGSFGYGGNRYPPGFHVKKSPRQMDLEIQNMSRNIFTPPVQPKLNSRGQPIKFFKDSSSVPVMFRKVIPPRGMKKLPLLHFEFAQDNSTCRCLCKL